MNKKSRTTHTFCIVCLFFTRGVETFGCVEIRVHSNQALGCVIRRLRHLILLDGTIAL